MGGRKRKRGGTLPSRDRSPPPVETALVVEPYKLYTEQATWLRAEAQRRGLSASAVLREAVARMMAGGESEDAASEPDDER